MKDSAFPEPPAPQRRLTALRMASTDAPVLDDSIAFLGLLRAFLHRKRLILSSCLITALVFFCAAAVQDRSYTAVASVMLDPREQRVVEAQDQVVSDLKLNAPILESEVAIVRSNALLQSAVYAVGLDRFAIMDQPSMAQDLVRNFRARYLTPAADAQDSRERRIIRALKQGLTARRVGDSYVIEISLSTPDPTLSAATVNALAESYIARQLQDRQRVAESATAWLATQVAGRRDDLAGTEAAIEAFKRTQLDMSLSTDAILEQQLVELNAQLGETRAARTTENARLEQIEKLTGEQGPLAAAETQQSPYILSMRTARSELAQKDLRLSGTIGQQHPDRKSIASEIAQLDTLIRQEVENIAQIYRNETAVLHIREASLQQEVARIQAELADNAAAKLTLRQLEREAEAARETYEEMLTRLGETRAQAEIQRAEARMVNTAEIPFAASSPRIRLWTAFGAALGLTAGLIAALSVEMVSSGFISSAEIERATGLPVLTTIPREKMAKPTAVLEKINGHSFSLFAERIRQLRTMLGIGRDAGASHTIAVLSSLPNEGKTTTALALARSFAMTGKKTLLLDLDTRRAVVMQGLTRANLRDLGDYLAGDATLPDVIYRDPTLGFSVAGSSKYTAILADSVSKLVLQDVVNKLRQRFEVIVIDTPPVLAVSDGLEIASVSDSVLYLVQQRKTSRKSAYYGLSALHHAGLRPTGIVLTKADAGSDPDNYAEDYTYD